jgi:hypothetical protein
MQVPPVRGRASVAGRLDQCESHRRLGGRRRCGDWIRSTSGNARAGHPMVGKPLGSRQLQIARYGLAALEPRSRRSSVWALRLYRHYSRFPSFCSAIDRSTLAHGETPTARYVGRVSRSVHSRGPGHVSPKRESVAQVRALVVPLVPKTSESTRGASSRQRFHRLNGLVDRLRALCAISTHAVSLASSRATRMPRVRR